MELPRERSGFCAGILAHLLITSFSAASVHFAKRCTILNQQGLKKITYTKKNHLQTKLFIQRKHNYSFNMTIFCSPPSLLILDIRKTFSNLRLCLQYLKSYSTLLGYYKDSR